MHVDGTLQVPHTVAPVCPCSAPVYRVCRVQATVPLHDTPACSSDVMFLCGLLPATML